MIVSVSLSKLSNKSGNDKCEARWTTAKRPIHLYLILKNQVWKIKFDKSSLKNQVWKIKLGKSSWKNQVGKIKFVKSNLKNQVWKIKFEKSSLKNQVWKFKFENSSLKNQVWRTEFLTCKNWFLQATPVVKICWK